MPPDVDAPSFGELVDARRGLIDEVQRHRASINYFASDTGFVRTAADAVDPPTPPIKHLGIDETLSGVTTSMTCFESLDVALLDPESSDPARFAGLSDLDRQRLDAFTGNVAQRTQDWKSEGAARRYCIVRAAVPLLRLGNVTDRDAIEKAVAWVWDFVAAEPAREAIYEVAPPHMPSDEHGDDEDPWADDDDPKRRYPPNAFLTAWALAAMDRLPTVRQHYEDTVSQAKLWMRSVIGRECAYVYGASRAADPQQLAWAITGLVASEDRPLADREAEATSLVDAGLRAFFAQQRSDGTWETGRALFHYPEAGNAYCYIYETLAELVGLVVNPQFTYHTEIRRLMAPYLGHLLRARTALSASGRRLGGDVGVGWSSGHHPHRTSPESWATATAYRFLQSLRRFVGMEVRDHAARRVQARRPRRGVGDLKLMGTTWDAGRGSAGDLIAALFINPYDASAREGAVHDPDRSQLASGWARSALLYGPPGTGKTTLAEAVAGALKWDFVEITPANFLDRGMELVSARADEIFRLLMELDRSVVLFDEIDELVRRRDAAGHEHLPQADMVGRFFTTTMLPRLANLWSARKVIFFANTNSLEAVDAAVRRSQRFDGAIFVMPPGLRPKRAAIGPAEAFIDAGAVEMMLADPTATPDHDPGKRRFGWLPFVRFDQLAILANGKYQNENEFLSRLEELGVEAAADWQIPERAPNDGPLELMKKLIATYRREAGQQRLDASRLRLVRLPEGEPPPDPPAGFVTADAPAGYAKWDADGSPGDVMNGAGTLVVDD